MIPDIVMGEALSILNKAFGGKKPAKFRTALWFFAERLQAPPFNYPPETIKVNVKLGWVKAGSKAKGNNFDLNLKSMVSHKRLQLSWINEMIETIWLNEREENVMNFIATLTGKKTDREIHLEKLENVMKGQCPFCGGFLGCPHHHEVGFDTKERKVEFFCNVPEDEGEEEEEDDADEDDDGGDGDVRDDFTHKQVWRI